MTECTRTHTRTHAHACLGQGGGPQQHLQQILPGQGRKMVDDLEAARQQLVSSQALQSETSRDAERARAELEEVENLIVP